MAVLVEALSVIVKRDSIDQYINGGWEKFISIVPNQTMCTDGELVRVGFMTPQDVECFVVELESQGLHFHFGDKKTQIEKGLRPRGDIIVIDQFRGPTTSCDWIEFGAFSLETSPVRIPACWLFDEPRIAHGLHFKGKEMTLVTPDGWTPENLKSLMYVPDSHHRAYPGKCSKL